MSVSLQSPVYHSDPHNVTFICFWGVISSFWPVIKQNFQILNTIDDIQSSLSPTKGENGSLRWWSWPFDIFNGDL